MNKLKTQAEIIKIVNALKQRGKIIVTTNGTFDLLHVGHVRTLEASKKYGDVLIVGLNSDKSVKSYKGNNRPINNEKYRAEMLSALACVDYVVLFDEPDPRKLLEKIKPDVHTNLETYGEHCVEAATMKKNGGRLVLLPVIDGYSTTDLIKKIKKFF